MIWNTRKAFMRDYFIQHNRELQKKAYEKIKAILIEEKKKHKKGKFFQQIKLEEQLSILTLREIEI